MEGIIFLWFKQDVLWLEEKAFNNDEACHDERKDQLLKHSHFQLVVPKLLAVPRLSQVVNVTSKDWSAHSSNENQTIKA